MPLGRGRQQKASGRSALLFAREQWRRGGKTEHEEKHTQRNGKQKMNKRMGSTVGQVWWSPPNGEVRAAVGPQTGMTLTMLVLDLGAHGVSASGEGGRSNDLDSWLGSHCCPAWAHCTGALAAGGGAAARGRSDAGVPPSGSSLEGHTANGAGMRHRAVSTDSGTAVIHSSPPGIHAAANANRLVRLSRLGVVGRSARPSGKNRKPEISIKRGVAWPAIGADERQPNRQGFAWPV